MFSTALFYIGERPELFERAFAEIGEVWRVPKIFEKKIRNEFSRREFANRMKFFTIFLHF